MKPTFAIIGCGRVGTAFAKYLAAAGYSAAGFASRSLDSAKKAAKIAGAEGKYFKHSWEATRVADIIFITTPDAAIADTCQILARNHGIGEKAVVLHCSGALPSTILNAAKRGSMHPLQSFAAVRTDNPFDHIMMAIEGDDEAVRVARAMASDLGAVPFIIRTEGKTLYHASAVVASNYLVTLMGLAIRLLVASGVGESDAFNILKPLVKGTLANIEDVGIPQALTGPIARGDFQTVAAHVAAMVDLPADVLELYKILGKATIDIAIAKGTLSEKAAQEILKIIQNASISVT